MTLGSKIEKVYSSDNWFRSCASIYSKKSQESMWKWLFKWPMQMLKKNAKDLCLWFSSKTKWENIETTGELSKNGEIID